MNWTLEVVMVPVADVDRAKAFYPEQVGFRVDHDSSRHGKRVVQLTPPGSACSIAIGDGISEMAPGTLAGIQLVVSDVRAARTALAARGVEVSEVQVFESGSFRPSREADALDNVGFVFFRDPDGNRWSVQQISARGR